MSSQSPESQLVSPLHGFSVKPLLSCLDDGNGITTVYDNTSGETNTTDCHSDDTVPDDDLDGKDAAGQDSPVSAVSDTQLVDAQYDTQATDAYDQSPVTQRATQKIDQTSAENDSIISPLKCIERQKPTITEEVSGLFRFARAPNPSSIRLSRPPPGKSIHYSERMGRQDLLPSPDGTAAGMKQGHSGGMRNGTNLPSRGIPRAKQFAPFEEEESKAMKRIATSEDSARTGRSLVNNDASQKSNRKASIIQTVNRDNSPTRHATLKPPFQILEASAINSKQASRSLTPPCTEGNHESLLRVYPQHTRAYAGAAMPSCGDRAAGGTAWPMVTDRDLGGETLSPRPLPAAVGINGLRKLPKSTHITSVTVLDCGALPVPEVKSSPAGNVNDALCSCLGDSNPKDSCALCSPSKAVIENTPSPTMRHMHPTHNAHGECPLEMLETMHSHTQDIEAHQSQCCISNASVNRPSSAANLQPQELELCPSPQLSHTPRVTMTKLPIATQTMKGKSSSRFQNEVFNTPTASQMVDILKVMMESEEGKHRTYNEIIEQRESQITNLAKSNSTLQKRVHDLEQKNKEMTKKITGFKDRCAGYKAHMNQVTEGHKALWERGEELKRARDDLLATLEERDRQNQEAQKKIEEVRELFSTEAQKTWRDARQKLADQDQMVVLLRRDLDNRLLDLQRERCLTERLQKQLDDRAKFHDNLESLLTRHQKDITTQLARCNSGIAEVLNAKEYNRERINQCLTLINNLKDNEPKTSPALEELIRLIKDFEKSIENRLEEKEDRDTRLRNTSGEAIAEVRTFIKGINSQQGAQDQLKECIVELRKDNAKLSEQIEGRESQISELNSQIGNIRRELEACRCNLEATANELNQSRAISAQEPDLRAHIRDLQEMCSGLKTEVESAIREAERTKSSFHISEESSALLRENIKSLKEALEQRISAFDKEKEAYVQACKAEFENQRLQTERDLNQRLEEQKEEHTSLVSGLRRQKADAEEKKNIIEGKLDALQAELRKSQQINTDFQRVASDLQSEIAVLEVRTCGREAEAGSFKGELESFQERHGSVAAELQIARDLIHQCINDTNKIAEETATKFEKLKELTGTQLHKIDEDNQVEIRRLKEELGKLQEQAAHSTVLQESASRYLRSKGVLEFGDSINNLATRITVQSSVQDGSNESGQSSRPSVHFNPTGTGSTTCPGTLITSATPLGTFEVNTIDPAYIFSDDAQYGNFMESRPLVSETFIVEPEYRSCHFKDDLGTLIASTQTQSQKLCNLERPPSPQSSMSYGTPIEITSDTQNSPANEATTHSAMASSFRRRHAAVEQEPSKGLASRGTVEVLDSQATARVPHPIFSRRSPNIARRRGSLPISPQAQKSDRVKHTQITDINIRKASTYESGSSAPGESGRRGLAKEPVLGELSDLGQSVHISEYQSSRDHEPSQFNVCANEPGGDSKFSKMPVQSIQRFAKLPKSILKRNSSVVSPTNKQHPGQLVQAPIMQDKPRASTTNKRLSRVPSTSEKLRGSRYNRVASGNPAAKRTAQLGNRAPEKLQGQVTIPFTPDLFAITDSPIQDPRRNALKRSGSILGSHPNQKAAKLQRH